MPFACPSCKADIPNVLTQEDHVARLNVKEDANKSLREQLTTAETKAAAAATLASENTRLTGELERQKGASAKVVAAAKVGLNPDKMRLAETAYEMAHEGVEAGKRPAFDAWLVAEDGARKNDDIKHLFAQAAPAAGAPGAPPPPKRDAAPPGAPPGGSTKLTAQQIQAYFHSPEFKALKREDQHAKVRELEAQAKQPPTTDGRT